MALLTDVPLKVAPPPSTIGATATKTLDKIRIVSGNRLALAMVARLSAAGQAGAETPKQFWTTAG